MEEGTSPRQGLQQEHCSSAADEGDGYQNWEKNDHLVGKGFCGRGQEGRV